MRRSLLDYLIAAILMAVFAIAWIYLDASGLRTAILAITGLLAVLFLILGIRNRNKQIEPVREVVLTPRGNITEIVLLSEEDTDLAAWEIYGKTSMVIGRDLGENHVDINLAEATYASMVDIEHAVLNYAAGNWYVEDLGSENGISIQKASDGRRYKLASEQMCRLEPLDILYIGMTRMVLR